MPLGLGRVGFTYQQVGGAPAVPSRTPKTTVNSGVTFSDTEKQFGTHSGYFDGADKISIANNSDFYLGTGPYTIEFWFNTADTLAEVVNQQDYGDNRGWAMGIRSSQRMLFAAGSDSEISVLVPSTGGWTDNTWAHVAVCKGSGGGVAIYANGVRKYHSGGWNVNIFDTIDDFFIGTGYGVTSGLFQEPGDGGTRGGYFYTGYIDELRISTVDRYGQGSTMTVPTESFENDEDTVLLMHFDNTGLDDGGPQ